MGPRFELVLPCFNESKSIQKIVANAAAAAQSAGMSPEDFQLILVENGSKDDSRIEMNRIKAGELGVWFRIVPIDVNQGYGFGLQQGLMSTVAPVVGWSHADQQCDPKDAFDALTLIHKSNLSQALVKGVRSGRDWKDVCVSRVFEFLARIILGVRVYEMNAQPKVFSRSLLSHLKDPPKTFAFDLYALYQAQKFLFQTMTIPVHFPPRPHGQSSWASNFFSRYKTILGIVRYMFRLAWSEGRL